MGHDSSVIVISSSSSRSNDDGDHVTCSLVCTYQTSLGVTPWSDVSVGPIACFQVCKVNANIYRPLSSPMHTLIRNGRNAPDKISALEEKYSPQASVSLWELEENWRRKLRVLQTLLLSDSPISTGSFRIGPICQYYPKPRGRFWPRPSDKAWR